MATEGIPVVDARKAYLYDGTNSADLSAKIDDFTVVGEDAVQLTFSSGGVQLSVPRNGYVIAQSGKVVAEDVYANEDDFRDANTPLADATAHKHAIVLHTGLGYMPDETDDPDNPETPEVPE